MPYKLSIPLTLRQPKPAASAAPCPLSRKKIRSASRNFTNQSTGKIVGKVEENK
jgi:hypothetical protein